MSAQTHLVATGGFIFMVVFLGATIIFKVLDKRGIKVNSFIFFGPFGIAGATAIYKIIEIIKLTFFF